MDISGNLIIKILLIHQLEISKACEFKSHL